MIETLAIFGCSTPAVNQPDEWSLRISVSIKVTHPYQSRHNVEGLCDPDSCGLALKFILMIEGPFRTSIISSGIKINGDIPRPEPTTTRSSREQLLTEQEINI